MNRFPADRNRLLVLQILLAAFLGGLVGFSTWRLFAFPPDAVSAACVIAFVAGGGLFPAAVFRIFFLLSASYEISASGSLTIRFGSWREVVPIEEIEEIRSGGRIPASVRKKASGWLEMWHGHVAGNGEEDIEWMATDRGQNLLILATKHRRLAVSPADPAGFARCLTDLSARGSLEKTEPVSQQPPLILADILKNPPALGLLAGGLAGIVSLGAFLTGIQPSLSPDQPFRFDPTTGAPTSPGSPMRLLILPMVGGFVWLVNAAIGWWMWRKGQQPPAYALWTVSLIVAIGLWAASTSLLMAK